MAKYSAEELSSRIDGLELEDEIKISLMEDITDSLAPEDTTELDAIKAELESVKDEYDSLKEKYKARFLKATDEVEESEEKAEDEELEEKEVIDIKTI